jgi:hypothetical protein
MVADLGAAVRPHLPQAKFPGAEKAGWWIKAVQVDPGAKGLIRRDTPTPLRRSRA